MIGIGFVIEGPFPFFGTVLLAQVIWGVAGRSQAAQPKRGSPTKSARRTPGTRFCAPQVAQIATLVGIVASVFIGNERVNLPIILGGIGFSALGIFLALFMPETGFHPTPRENRNSFQHMWHTFREGVAMVRKRPALSTILGLVCFTDFTAKASIDCGRRFCWRSRFQPSTDSPPSRGLASFALAESCSASLRTKSRGGASRRTTRTRFAARYLLSTLECRCTVWVWFVAELYARGCRVLGLVDVAANARTVAHNLGQSETRSASARDGQLDERKSMRSDK